jgi:hypothetical protein
MVLQAKPVRPSAPSPRTGVPAARSSGVRRRNDAGHATTRSRRPPSQGRSAPPSPPTQSASLPDRGIRVLLAFFGAAMIMVLGVVLVGAVGQWWVLVLVMLVDFIVTFVVLALVVELLGDGSGDSA